MANRAYLDTTGAWGEKAERERKKLPHYIYFIECRAVPHQRGPIKIGIAHNPEQRVKNMAGGNPYPLDIIAVVVCENFRAARKGERELHTLFAEHRFHREWFEPHQEIWNWLETNAERWGQQ